MKQHPTRTDIYIDDSGALYRRLAVSRSSDGYHTVKIGKETIRRHTLIVETFIGERPFPAAQVRHLDGDPSNDDLANLRWGTPAENGADTVRHGRSTRGERNAQSKLTEETARQARARRRAGESLREVAADYGVSVGTVCDLAAGRTWAWLDD